MLDEIKLLEIYDIQYSITERTFKEVEVLLWNVLK